MTAAALTEIADFLRRHPPFDALAPEDLEQVAAAAEIEFHPAGSTIFAEGEKPVRHLRVVRSGAVELVFEGRVLDLVGEGEVFGQASMLSGLPTGFTARAAEDTLCYRIDEEVARRVLSRPETLRFVARTLLDAPRPVPARSVVGEPERDPARRAVSELMRSPLLLCPPDTTIREVARHMTVIGTSSAVIDLGDRLGIVTDSDLRTRVVAGGLDGQEAVSRAMTAPAYTVAADRLGGEVLLDMLDRGVRHFPVLSSTGRVIGVVEDLDLVAVEARSSFYLRRAIARATSVSELVAACQDVRPTLLALHDSGLGALNVSAILAVVLDALTRRLIEIVQAQDGESPTSFAWLALGSHARREVFPGSDVDSALVWYGGQQAEEVQPRLLTIGRRVCEGLAACGFPNDEKGATAADPLLVRSFESWQRAARGWLDDPTQDRALILVSVLVDSRPVWGISAGPLVADALRPAAARPALLRQLARLALSYRPPTGFLRGLVVEHSGEHRGRLDLKHGGLLPIIDLARWAGMSAGVSSASTVERLRAGGEAGSLQPADARTLEEAFTLIAGLRLDRHVACLRAGQPPNDFLDPAELSRLTRSHLKEAFRAVASVQKRIAGELQFGVR